MRQAMVNAELGDDVLGDDPTAKRLEAMAAERLGKEAALIVPSGTMANLISLLVYARRGDEVIVGSQAHVLQVEVGGAAGLGGVLLRAAHNDERGRMDLDEVRSMIRPPAQYGPRTAAIFMENTHNLCNGSPLSASYTAQVAAIAHEAGAALHIDGARIFNAAVAQETTPAELARDADSASFCLSKGLSCPIGSVLTGSEEYIQQARRIRRTVGGGMRQVGVIAAAGIVALDEMVDRLADDHVNARLLAEGLSKIPGINIDPALVQTNLVFCTTEGIDGNELVSRLRERGVLSSGSPQRLRMVTHYGIERADVEYTVEAVREVVASLS
ncbi:MAG: aminotransferase class I/II-fold pyridoxal phosphate-dependent enzyme [Dehalococcoidia bacterium]|nr:aminotransferase class I/II-fold pyridoxal phosphate-dependent enzyme [Dehalococcoidia bacterium]